MKNPHTSICQPLVPKPGATCLSSTPSRNTPDAQHRGHHDVEPIQEAQFRILEQILHPRQIRCEMLVRHEPAHVAPKEAVLHGRVHVVRLVRVDVVVAMMGRPPDRAALHRRGAQQAEDELTDARGLEGAVRKVAMIETGDGEHAHHVERHVTPSATQLKPTQITARQAACINKGRG
jgi:hypothetical protein